MTECVECGKNLNDPKNAGDPDENGEWVCTDPVCRSVHSGRMTVVRVEKRVSVSEVNPE